MPILALDYGSRRVGVALSDPTGTLARPLPFLPAQGDVKLARTIRALAEKEKVDLILLGLPRHMDGTLGEAAAKVQTFTAVLKESTGIVIQLVDERLSTIQASRQLRESGRDARKQRDRIDSEAACVLLQSYLDARSLPLPDET